VQFLWRKIRKTQKAKEVHKADPPHLTFSTRLFYLPRPQGGEVAPSSQFAFLVKARNPRRKSQGGEGGKNGAQGGQGSGAQGGQEAPRTSASPEWCGEFPWNIRKRMPYTGTPVSDFDSGNSCLAYICQNQ